MTAQSTDAAERSALIEQLEAVKLELAEAGLEHAAELSELRGKVGDLMERARAVGYDAGLWRGCITALVISNAIWLGMTMLGRLA